MLDQANYFFEMHNLFNCYFKKYKDPENLGEH